MSEKKNEWDDLPDPRSPTFDQEMTVLMKQMRAKIPPGKRAARPRDAATIVITRRGRTTIEVLMGRRHHGHKFMPNAFVFPGGRVDVADGRVFPGLSLSSEAAERLGGVMGTARARAFGLAAIRETFEEAGIAIGRPLSPELRGSTKAPSWKSFVAAGYVPALDALKVIGRAVTPPVQPKRFDTWFFNVDVEDVPAAATPVASGSGELEELQWVAIDATDPLNLPAVQKIVLIALEEQLAMGASALPKMMYIRFQNGRYRTDPL